MKEIFKPMIGYKGLYEVSNKGRVKSLKRTASGKSNSKRNLPEIIMSLTKGRGGYLGVNLSKNSKRVRFQAHQLVAIVFLNHKPCGHKIVVDHIDNNLLNNNLTNLQTITHRENCSKDRVGKGTSNYVGVIKISNEAYGSSIKINGKSIWIGTFKTEIKAHNAYQEKLKSISK